TQPALPPHGQSEWSRKPATRGPAARNAVKPRCFYPPIAAPPEPPPSSQPSEPRRAATRCRRTVPLLWCARRWRHHSIGSATNYTSCDKFASVPGFYLSANGRVGKRKKIGGNDRRPSVIRRVCGFATEPEGLSRQQYRLRYRKRRYSYRVGGS